MVHPSSLQLLRSGIYDFPESVVSTAKLLPAFTCARIFSISRRPAANAAASTFCGEMPRAMSSALRNGCNSKNSGNKTRAVVVFPAPLGPPSRMILFTIALSIDPYAGTNSFFPPFFSGSTIGTGPCVSTVGGGGASPIRFE